VPLVQPVATVGGTVGIADGVWVSDAAAGLVQVVTARGAAAFPVAAPRVYGLAPEAPNGVVFATDAGYGVVEDAGLSQTFSARMSSGEALAPGEIQYLQSEGVIFLGGSQTQGAQCADTIFVFLAGGRSPQPYPGDPGSAPCGLPIHHLTTDGTYVWFGETNVTPHVLAAVTPLGANVTRALPAAAKGATPGELIAGVGGDVYFSLCGAVDTRPGGNAYLLRVNAGSPLESLYSTYAPCANGTNSMVGDANDGRIWIANGTNTLTAVRASDGAVSSYTLPSTPGATGGFVAVTEGPDRALWAFRDGDADAHAYGDRLIGADPSYVYTLHGAPVTVSVAEYQYSGGFTATIAKGSSATCVAAPVPGVPVTRFAVTSAPGTECTVAFSDANGVGTVYVPVVTHAGANVPPQPQMP